MPVLRAGRAGDGEEHPLLAVIAEHSVGLLTVVRAVLDESDAAGLAVRHGPGSAAARTARGAAAG